MRACPECETEAPEPQRFCVECGAAIEANTALPNELPRDDFIPYIHIPEPDPLIGRVIADRFECTNVIGSGCDSRYYSVTDLKTTERLTARLFFYGRCAPKNELISRLKLQHTRIRKLDHPAISRIRGILPEPDFLAVILDQSGQATLENYLKPSRVNDVSFETFQRRKLELSKSLLKDIFVKIFDAVSAMHNCNQVNGYLTADHILVDEQSSLKSPQIKLCAFGTREGSASSHPDRFHYDDDKLIPAADVWYLSMLIEYFFSPLVAPFADELAPILKQAGLESRTNRIQTLAALREGLAPIFETDWSDAPISEFEF